MSPTEINAEKEKRQACRGRVGWKERDETKTRNHFWYNNCCINTWLANMHAPWHSQWEISKTVNTRKMRILDPNSWNSQPGSSWHIETPIPSPHKWRHTGAQHPPSFNKPINIDSDLVATCSPNIFFHSKASQNYKKLISRFPVWLEGLSFQSDLPEVWKQSLWMRKSILYSSPLASRQREQG